MGKRRIEMKKIESLKARQVCFSKRRQGLFNKAKQLSVLCDVDVLIVTFSVAGKPFAFSSSPSSSPQSLINRFLSSSEEPSSTSSSTSTPGPGVSSSHSPSPSWCDRNDVSEMREADLHVYLEGLKQMRSAATRRLKYLKKTTASGVGIGNPPPPSDSMAPVAELLPMTENSVMAVKELENGGNSSSFSFTDQEMGFCPFDLDVGEIGGTEEVKLNDDFFLDKEEEKMTMMTTMPSSGMIDCNCSSIDDGWWRLLNTSTTTTLAENNKKIENRVMTENRVMAVENAVNSSSSSFSFTDQEMGFCPFDLDFGEIGGTEEVKLNGDFFLDKEEEKMTMMTAMPSSGMIDCNSSSIDDGWWRLHNTSTTTTTLAENNKKTENRVMAVENAVNSSSSSFSFTDQEMGFCPFDFHLGETDGTEDVKLMDNFFAVNEEEEMMMMMMMTVPSSGMTDFFSVYQDF